ncbi:MAG: MBL fold metallo-hydrolase [Clostridiales bacterium]|jgi:phosphoribosyl 1,2-cyclic phosphate phosphodiesterase|nr:MBL fold metallo-hydrolase [Clostridiales bacterium]
MKLKFLGTGGVLGTPVWNCNCKACTSEDARNVRMRPSFLVQLANTNIIIDFGKDFHQQVLKYSLPHIDFAFLTHAHQDHIGGFEQFSSNGKCIVTMPTSVFNDFWKDSSADWITARNPEMLLSAFQGVRKIENFSISPVKLNHNKDFSPNYVPAYGYVFRSDDFSFAYLGDHDKVLEPEKLENLDLLITDGNRWEDNGWGHAGIAGGLKEYEKYKPKRMIFTHLSHDIEHNDAQWHVRQIGNIDIAYDGMEVEF